MLLNFKSSMLSLRCGYGEQKGLITLPQALPVIGQLADWDRRTVRWLRQEDSQMTETGGQSDDWDTERTVRWLSERRTVRWLRQWQEDSGETEIVKGGQSLDPRLQPLEVNVPDLAERGSQSCLPVAVSVHNLQTRSPSLLLVECCFTSTQTVGLLGTGAQDVHLDFHTAPELWPSLLYGAMFTKQRIRSRTDPPVSIF